MNEIPPKILSGFINALNKYPDHQSEADDLSQCDHGLLIFFHPPKMTAEAELDWQTAVKNLAEAYPVLKSSGIGVIGVVPQISNKDFFNRFIGMTCKACRATLANSLVSFKS